MAGRKLKKPLIYPELEEYATSYEELEILKRIEEEARRTAPPAGVIPKIRPSLKLREKNKLRIKSGTE